MASQKKPEPEPSTVVPKSICTRLAIALVWTGSISKGEAKRAMNERVDIPDEKLDELGVMCAWDVYDEARKARVRAVLRRYFPTVQITFIGIPTKDVGRIKQMRDVLYATKPAVPKKRRASR